MLLEVRTVGQAQRVRHRGLTKSRGTYHDHDAHVIDVCQSSTPLIHDRPEPPKKARRPHHPDRHQDQSGVAEKNKVQFYVVSQSWRPRHLCPSAHHAQPSPSPAFLSSPPPFILSRSLGAEEYNTAPTCLDAYHLLCKKCLFFPKEGLSTSSNVPSSGSSI